MELTNFINVSENLNIFIEHSFNLVLKHFQNELGFFLLITILHTATFSIPGENCLPSET